MGTIYSAFKELEIQKGERILTSPTWTDVFYNLDLRETTLDWKQKIIDRNILFYEEHQEFIDEWYAENNVADFSTSNKKLEWNANSSINSLWDGIIQFRPSGVRIKKPDVFPTFVAINHKPIIGKLRRYITPTEISSLYGFENLRLDINSSESYKQLGNTISVDVAEIVITELIREVNGDE